MSFWEGKLFAIAPLKVPCTYQEGEKRKNKKKSLDTKETLYIVIIIIIIFNLIA